MSNFDNSVIDEIINRVDIVDLVSEHVVLKEISSSNHQGLCPFHKEKTPSFIVNNNKQIFKCFGCGAGGNIFEFYKLYFRVDFKEALEALASKAGIDLKLENSIKSTKKSIILEIYKLSSLFYQKLINDKNYSSIPLEYLNFRNIDNEIIDYFKIGYSANSWNSLYLYIKDQFSKEDLLDSGLFLEKSNNELYDRFRNRIIFPIQNDKNETIAFGARLIENINQAKYINSPETLIYTKGDNLFAFNLAKKDILEKGYIILVEGYLDVIRCHKYGFKNTVASLGTALTQNQCKKILKYTKKIVMAYDSDEAGQTAIERGSSIFKELSKLDNTIEILILQIPNWKDPDEFLNKEGAEKFKILIENAKPFFEFKLDKILNSWDKNSNSKKIIFDRCIELLLKVEHSIQVDELIKKIINFRIDALSLDFKESDIRRKLNFIEYISNIDNKEKYYKKNFGINQKKFKDGLYIDKDKKILIQKTLENFEKTPKELKAEQGIIYFLIERHKAANYIKEKLEYISFFDEINKKILNFIFDNIDIEKPLKWNDLLKTFIDSKEQSCISEICSMDIDIKSDKLLKDYIKVIKSNLLNYQKQELRNDIENETNIDIINILMQVYNDTQKELENIKRGLYSDTK